MGNGIQKILERLSDIKDTLAEINSSTKEYLMSNKSLTQNIQEISENMKRPNLRILGVEECAETQLKGAEKIFNQNI